jgi:hypothetical protein
MVNCDRSAGVPPAFSDGVIEACLLHARLKAAALDKP